MAAARRGAISHVSLECLATRNASLLTAYHWNSTAPWLILATSPQVTEILMSSLTLDTVVVSEEVETCHL